VFNFRTEDLKDEFHMKLGERKKTYGAHRELEREGRKWLEHDCVSTFEEV
jgi:hypothetical protein